MNTFHNDGDNDDNFKNSSNEDCKEDKNDSKIYDTVMNNNVS